jgi:hypothetical protein
MRLLRFIPMVASGVLLAGCQSEGHSPTVDVLGSYFPAWMVCIIIGLTITLILRQLFIGFKLDSYLRPAVLIYPSLAILFTLAVWLIFFKN